MKSLMRIYFSYIATALAIIAAFVVLQVVLLGIVTSKLYENESGGGLPTGDGGLLCHAFR